MTEGPKQIGFLQAGFFRVLKLLKPREQIRLLQNTAGLVALLDHHGPMQNKCATTFSIFKMNPPMKIGFMLLDHPRASGTIVSSRLESSAPTAISEILSPWHWHRDRVLEMEIQKAN